MLSVKDFIIDRDEVMVSFDISSLFTNVPIDEASDVINLSYNRTTVFRREHLYAQTTSYYYSIHASRLPILATRIYSTNRKKGQLWDHQYHLSSLTYLWNILST